MKFCRLKVSLIQFLTIALSVIFFLVYANCDFASVSNCLLVGRQFVQATIRNKAIASKISLLRCAFIRHERNNAHKLVFAP